METSVAQFASAWQPLTPRGVAAFARARPGRLILFQFAVALLAAGVTVWAVNTCWFPVVSAAITALPEQGVISAGRLNWPDQSARALAENRFMGVSVDLNHGGVARSAAQVQVEFGQTDVRFYSLFGCLAVPYSRSYSMPFNVLELKPWWGAWSPVFLFAVAAGVCLGLLGSWAILATLYSLPGWLAGLYLNRQLSLGGSWRLAGAALLPAAMVMTLAVAFYALAYLDLVRLIAAGLFHVVLGWTYLLLGVVACPKIESEAARAANPFRPEPEKSAENPASVGPTAAQNPFRPRGD